VKNSGIESMSLIDMLLWTRRLVLAAALVAVPFQGMAATLSVLLCHGDAAAHAEHAAQPQHDHGAGQLHDHGQPVPDDADGNGGFMYHLCCNLSASLPVSVTFGTVLPEFTVLAFVPDPLLDLYDPEQPQRPPLA
jgi:hypothetical protein